MKLQATTNPLILKDTENEFFTSTRIIAQELKINRDFMSDMHKTLHNYFFVDGGIDYINTYCLKNGQSALHPSDKILNSAKVPNIFREIKKIPKAEKIENKVYWTYELGYGEKFYLSFYNDRGRMLPYYLMNERAYITFIMQLGRYTKAIKIQQKITQAFFMMREIIKNQPQPKLKFKEVEVKNFGELSKANKIHGRTEEVRGYFRSDRNKELSRLYGERKRLQHRLGGLMDLDILERLKKIDMQIDKVQKTPIQEELSSTQLRKAIK